MVWVGEGAAGVNGEGAAGINGAGELDEGEATGAAGDSRSLGWQTSDTSP